MQTKQDETRTKIKTKPHILQQTSLVTREAFHREFSLRGVFWGHSLAFNADKTCVQKKGKGQIFWYTTVSMSKNIFALFLTSSSGTITQSSAELSSDCKKISCAASATQEKINHITQFLGLCGIWFNGCFRVRYHRMENSPGSWGCLEPPQIPTA